MISTTASTPSVLLIGGDFQSLGVMRALAQEDIPCFLLASERGIATHSRFAKRQARKYDLLTNPNSVDFLRDLVKRESLQGWAVFCVNDDTVEFLAKNHEELSKFVIVPVPAWSKTEKFIDKKLAHEVAAQCGVPVPWSVQAESIDELSALVPSYPAVLKPCFKKNYYEITKRKAILVCNQEELRKEFLAMNSLIPSSQIVVQQFIEGGTKNLWSVAALFDGHEIVSGLTANRLRQHPMDFGHATTYAEERGCDEIWDLATKFLRALEYRGVAEIEFMYDEASHQFRFIEMNGRFFGWHSLTQFSGLNLPVDLFRLMTGQPVVPRSSSGDARWMRAITDVPTVFSQVVKGRMSLVRDYFPTMVAKKGFAVWSWSDPLPSIVELMMAPYLWIKKGF